jgi:hypothetical protein
MKRRSILVVHRRGGKSVFCVNQTIHAGIYFNKTDPKTGKRLLNPTYAYIAPTYRQVKEIAWEYFLQYGRKLPGFGKSISELKVWYDTPTGKCTISLIGAENFETFRGRKFDGYVLDEASIIPLSKVRDEILLATIADRLGWEIVIGTPKGHNEFKRLLDSARMSDDWYTRVIPVTETRMIHPEELKELKRTMSEEAFEQEFMCNFNAIPSGYFYQRQIEDSIVEGRVNDIPWHPNYPVNVAWDLGRDTMSLWFFQEVGRETRFIDYWQDAGKGLPDAVKYLQSKRYVYGTMVYPHDIKYTDLVTNTSRLDYMTANGFTNYDVVPKTESVSEDTHTVRQVIPMCLFDKTNCAEGVMALSQYRRKWDDILQIYSENPVHDKYSHGADSFRQFAKWYQPGFGDRLNGRKNLPDVAEHDYDIFGQ